MTNLLYILNIVQHKKEVFGIMMSYVEYVKKKK